MDYLLYRIGGNFRHFRQFRHLFSLAKFFIRELFVLC